MNSTAYNPQVETDPVCLYSARTPKDRMYTLIAAIHALNNERMNQNDMYLGECQDPSHLNEDIVRGNLLICSYTVRFVFGIATVKQALQTAKNLSAIGVIFYMDPFVIGYQLNPTPMSMPGLIISSPEDSKVRFCGNARLFPFSCSVLHCGSPMWF